MNNSAPAIVDLAMYIGCSAVQLSPMNPRSAPGICDGDVCRAADREPRRACPFNVSAGDLSEDEASGLRDGLLRDCDPSGKAVERHHPTTAIPRRVTSMRNAVAEIPLPSEDGLDNLNVVIGILPYLPFRW
jgi:hypothetical protein